MVRFITFSFLLSVATSATASQNSFLCRSDDSSVALEFELDYPDSGRAILTDAAVFENPLEFPLQGFFDSWVYKGQHQTLNEQVLVDVGIITHDLYARINYKSANGSRIVDLSCVKR